MAFSSLILAPSATPGTEAALAAMSGACVAIGARPVVVALPAGIEPPAGTRVVRVKSHDSTISAIRLGMAQLTNTTSTAVILCPLGAGHVAAGALLAMVETAARDRDALVALAGVALDDGPLLVPRDAWLELVTLGEGGLGALAARRRVVWVDVPTRRNPRADSDVADGGVSEELEHDSDRRPD